VRRGGSPRPVASKRARQSKPWLSAVAIAARCGRFPCRRCAGRSLDSTRAFVWHSDHASSRTHASARRRERSPRRGAGTIGFVTERSSGGCTPGSSFSAKAGASNGRGFDKSGRVVSGRAPVGLGYGSSTSEASGAGAFFHANPRAGGRLLFRFRSQMAMRAYPADHEPAAGLLRL
jgi:hypothetical protein